MIDEAVRIRESGDKILNAKEDYKRNTIPVLTTNDSMEDKGKEEERRLEDKILADVTEE